MTRKKTTRQTTEEIETPAADQDLDAFERARLDFEDLSRVKLDIARYDREEGRARYLKRVDYDAKIIDYEWIRRKYGPGCYQLRFRDADESRWKWSQVIDIAPDESSERPPAPASSDANLLVMLQDQNRIMLQAIVNASLKPASGGGSDAVLAKLIEGMSAQNNTVLQAMLGRGDGSSKILDVFERGLELARDSKLESEGGWLSQIGRIARDLIPAIQELNKMQPIGVTPRPAVTRAAQLTPGAAEPAPAPSSPVEETSKETNESFTRPAVDAVKSSEGETIEIPAHILEDTLRQFAPQVIEAIQQGASAGDVADGILQSVPPMFYPELQKVTSEKVIMWEPQLAPHRAFVEQLVKELQSVNEDESSESSAG